MLALAGPCQAQAWWTLPYGSPERAAAQQAARQRAVELRQRATESIDLLYSQGYMGPEEKAIWGMLASCQRRTSDRAGNHVSIDAQANINGTPEAEDTFMRCVNYRLGR